MSLWRRNWYVNEMDLFVMSLWRLIGTEIKPTNLRHRNDVRVRCTNLAHGRVVTTNTLMRPTSSRRCSDVLDGTRMRRLNYCRCRKTYYLLPKRNWSTLLTNLNVLDHAETSSRRLNWYVNKTDLFETFSRRLTCT